MTLHRVASSYHTDPGTVLTWDPFRLALAVAALDQADASRAEQLRKAETVQPVIDLGRL